jgi:hypothetical protein
MDGDTAIIEASDGGQVRFFHIPFREIVMLIERATDSLRSRSICIERPISLILSSRFSGKYRTI